MADPIEEAIGKGAAAVLIAGPTASGKSRLALDLARRHGGTIVNADSMQVYAELSVLTARPTAEDEGIAPHRLYGHVAAARRYSVGGWLDDVAAALAEVRAEGQLPILVGGTGLYFKALTEGLVAIPAIPSEVRARLGVETEGLSSPALHARLAEVDPDDAAHIRATDRSRILRALEVYETTGRSLVRWQEAPPVAPIFDSGMAVRLVIEPDRAELHRRIAERAEHMVHGGALAEVEALGALRLDPALPAMKAIGVRELLGHLRGDISLDEAIAAIKTETRRYAKRQMTWFRHQTADWTRYSG
jgi:tRNA dimethylallyltransferase